MMNYLAGLLGIALLGAITTSAIYRADAADAKLKLTTLEASYSQAAQQAKDDAAKTEAADLANIKYQTTKAIQSAQTQRDAAKTALQAYLAKGKASKGSDLSHACFNVPIAQDLLPGQK